MDFPHLGWGSSGGVDEIKQCLAKFPLLNEKFLLSIITGGAANGVGKNVWLLELLQERSV